MNGAAREVIAEIAFQAATKAQVEWTAAFGYQTAPVNGVLTGDTVFKSLGERWFGLAKTTSIILGNQATGETGTLLSALTVTYSDDNGSSHTVDNPKPYAYPGVEIAKTDVTPNASAAIKVPTGLKLAGTTGLDLFGHKVEAWYNDDDPSAAKQTYAILDRANLAKTVYSPDGTDGNKLSDVAFTTNAAAAKSLGAAAMAAGFDVDLEASKAHGSDAYNRIANATAATATASLNGLYALVSNNSDKTVDVIVALSAEVAEITQKNTIANTQTLTLAGRGTAATTPAQIAASTFKNGTPGTAGVIYVKSLVEGSETELGAKVTAWQVKGTNDATTYNADSTTTGDKATNKNMPYFQLDKVTKSVTGTVVSYDSTANGKLTMSDGKVYERSYLWSKVVKGAIQSPLDTAGKVEFAAGVNYTIWLDDDGRWLGATTAFSDFLYGTYADYAVGELGSAEMKYYVTGVTIDGEIVKNVPMTSLLQGGQPYPGTTPAAKTLGDGYNALGISKKNTGDAAGGGNQILAGVYTGYLKDAEGNMDADGTKTAADYGKVLGDVKRLNDATATWQIDKDDVANGFADLSGDGKLVATKDTTFILVSGTGINDVKVEKLEGIEALLKGYSKVELDASAAPTTADTTPFGNTYYLMASDRFNKVDTSNNTLVDTVILDARDLTYTGATSLFFALNSNTTDVVLAGTDPTKVKQYKLYNDGELGTYFVTTDTTAYPDAETPTGADSSGDFFELVKVDEVNGVPVYKAVAAEDQNGTVNLDMANTTCDTDVTYSYVGVSNLLTAWLTKGTGKVLANVANAKVVDVEFNADCEHAEIKSIEDLNRAVSGLDSWSGTIELAIVNDGINVSMIYVTKVP